MSTLIVVLTVIAVSAAVVLRIVLGDEPQPATRPRRATGRPTSGEDGPAVVEPGDGGAPATVTSPVTGPAPSPRPEPAVAGSSSSPAAQPATTTATAPTKTVPHDRPPTAPRPAPPRRPVRSGILLVFLVTAVGCLLALVVAVALGLLVTATRAGLG